MAEAQTIEGANVRTGLIQGIGAYFIWGLLPLYFLPLKSVGSGEIVADRIVWSLLLLIGIVLFARRMPRLRSAIADRRVMVMLLMSAMLIAANWLVYIWAIQHGHVLEASLGYFLNPLINVVLGVALLRERLTSAQAVAVALAAAGVLVLAMGAGDGLWISLTLGLSFGLYGLVRKVVRVESLEGLTIETALLSPFAIGYASWLASEGALEFGRTPGITTLLILSGIITAVPLLLFAASARRLRYSTIGLLQYLAPTLQFITAITIFGEPMTRAHTICFVLIWSGLALYVVSSLRPVRGTAAAA